MSEPKKCARCGMVGHWSNKCKWPAYRKPQETKRASAPAKAVVK